MQKGSGGGGAAAVVTIRGTGNNTPAAIVTTLSGTPTKGKPSSIHAERMDSLRVRKVSDSNDIYPDGGEIYNERVDTINAYWTMRWTVVYALVAIALVVVVVRFTAT